MGNVKVNIVKSPAAKPAAAPEMGIMPGLSAPLIAPDGATGGSRKPISKEPIPQSKPESRGQTDLETLAQGTATAAVPDVEIQAAILGDTDSHQAEHSQARGQLEDVAKGIWMQSSVRGDKEPVVQAYQKQQEAGVTMQSAVRGEPDVVPAQSSVDAHTATGEPTQPEPATGQTIRPQAPTAPELASEAVELTPHQKYWKDRWGIELSETDAQIVIQFLNGALLKFFNKNDLMGVLAVEIAHSRSGLAVVADLVRNARTYRIDAPESIRNLLAHENIQTAVSDHEQRLIRAAQTTGFITEEEAGALSDPAANSPAFQRLQSEIRGDIRHRRPAAAQQFLQHEDVLGPQFQLNAENILVRTGLLTGNDRLDHDTIEKFMKAWANMQGKTLRERVGAVSGTARQIFLLLMILTMGTSMVEQVAGQEQTGHTR